MSSFWISLIEHFYNSNPSMAPNKKVTANDAATQDATTSKHGFKDLAKKVDMMSTQDQIIQGQCVRLDEHAKRQDEQGASIIEQSAKLNAFATDLAKLRDDLQRLSQEVSRGQVLSGDKFADSIQTSVNQNPWMMICQTHWDLLNVRSNTLMLVTCALERPAEELSLTDKIPGQYHESAQKLINDIKSLIIERDEARTHATKCERISKLALGERTNNQKINEGLSQDNDHLQAEIKALSEDLRECEARNMELSSKTSRHQETLNEIEEDKRSLLSENARLQKAMKDFEGDNHFLMGKNKVLQDTVNNYEEQLRGAIRELMRVKEDLAEFEGED
ncbi:MAG: hypothetical protein Q9160_007898 [Pyrenula sp. 1 TL-2023]